MVQLRFWSICLGQKIAFKLHDELWTGQIRHKCSCYQGMRVDKHSNTCHVFLRLHYSFLALSKPLRYVFPEFHFIRKRIETVTSYSANVSFRSLRVVALYVAGVRMTEKPSALSKSLPSSCKNLMVSQMCQESQLIVRAGVCHLRFLTYEDVLGKVPFDLFRLLKA